MAVTQKPNDLTITEAASAIATGKLTTLQLVKSCLERIDALEEKIQAWAFVDREGAIKAARRLDAESRQGKPHGPLHGIPMGIKDIFYTAGLPTKAGSRTHADFIPTFDAESVARLKKAGAIILGKTHTTEFAFLDPAPTRNPWNTEHTPGGSSSGSGASVAAGMCLAALGSQTLGSTLRPAAFNGIVGFKPQHGRISTYGVVPLAWSLDHVGILARNVEDAAIIFQAIAGYDPKDYNSLDEVVPDCLKSLGRKKAPRLGLAGQYFSEYASEEMRQHVKRVAESLRQAGAEVKEIELPPSFPDIFPNGRLIMSVEAATYHQEMFATHRNQYGTEIGKFIEQGLGICGTNYVQAQRKRLQHFADVKPLLSQVDAILTPGAPGAAPRGLVSTGNPVMQAPWTILGLPTISLPIGLNKDGLPLAIQLMGQPLAEDKLITVARWCEQALNVHLKPPIAQ